jgi:tripartite-type tricarboxylate transporter receptor subunit TctC
MGVRHRTACAGVVVVLLSALAPFVAYAQESVEQFYKGKQINLVIGTSPGGGYDTYGRLVARRLGNYIPGNPTIVPQNMPGAGSNKAAGYIYSVAPKDGTAISAIFSGAILQPLLGEPAGQHDPSKFIYVGNANNEVFLCLARSDAPVKSFADVLQQELIVGASSEGGSTRDFPTLLNNILGAKFRIVTGYPGSNEITLALERGEIQGICGIGWSSVAAQHPHWLANGTVRLLAQEATKGHPTMNKMGVPLTLDFAKTAEDRQVMELVYSQLIFGRPYVFGPGVPADRVAAVRKAFMAAVQDKESLAEAQKMQIDLDALGGEEVQSAVAKAYAMPPHVIERAKQALIYKPR